jgi:hypothetical protein
MLDWPVLTGLNPPRHEDIHVEIADDGGCRHPCVCPCGSGRSRAQDFGNSGGCEEGEQGSGGFTVTGAA